jgi:hypothetical protein
MQNVWSGKINMQEFYSNKRAGQIWKNVRLRTLIAGMLAKSQLAFGRPCYRTTRTRFSVVFLDPGENSE